MDVLVIGARGFGRHYLRILQELRAELPLLGIDTIIGTHTTQKDVDEANSAQDDVLYCTLKDPRELPGLLTPFSHVFVAAKDPEKGDDIHPAYVAAALDFGVPVLCEKPFARATGDGRSLYPLRLLRDTQGFGLELPMAVVGRALRRGPLYERFMEAASIEFVWQSPRAGADAIDDLALHPWALLPEEMTYASAFPKPGESAIRCCFFARARTTVVWFSLGRGAYRGFRIDETWYDVTDEERDGHRETVIRETGVREPLVRVENPLRQQIIASLRNAPIVGFERTYAAQRFLEGLHGYRG